jgi:hypothetical protein
MPSKEQVLGLLAGGCDYAEVGRRLEVPPGQAHLIATGIAADGGDTVTRAQRDRPGLLESRAQRLVNPRESNPNARAEVREWIRWRVSTDLPMREAAEKRQQQ